MEGGRRDCGEAEQFPALPACSESVNLNFQTKDNSQFRIPGPCGLQLPDFCASRTRNSNSAYDEDEDWPGHKLLSLSLYCFVPRATPLIIISAFSCHHKICLFRISFRARTGNIALWNNE